MSRQSPPSLPSDRSFGLTFAIVFGLIGGWMLWKSSSYAIGILGAATAFLVVALLLPRVLHPLNVAWMHFGHLLNRVVSPVVMGVIFFGLLTPLAAFMRMRGRDVLHRRFDPTLESYWIKRDPPGPDGSSFPRQF